jgi:hypothetical protein
VDADHPWGRPPDEIGRWLERLERGWGRGVSARLFAPSLADDEEFVQSWARLERHAVSPGGARDLLRLRGTRCGGGARPDHPRRAAHRGV